MLAELLLLCVLFLPSSPTRNQQADWAMVTVSREVNWRVVVHLTVPLCCPRLARAAGNVFAAFKWCSFRMSNKSPPLQFQTSLRFGRLPPTGRQSPLSHFHPLPTPVRASAWYSAEDPFAFLPVCSTRQVMCFSGFRRRSLRVRRRVGVQVIQIQLRAPLTNWDPEPKKAAWLPSVNRFDTNGRDGRRSCCNDTAIRNGHT